MAVGAAVGAAAAGTAAAGAGIGLAELMTIVGTGIGIAGGIQSLFGAPSREGYTSEQRWLLREEATLLEKEAAFAVKTGGIQAEMMRETAALTGAETGREIAAIQEGARATLGTQSAGAAAGGLAPGSSFAAVRNRFTQNLQRTFMSTKERGELASSQLLQKAALTEEAAGLESERKRWQAEYRLTEVEDWMEEFETQEEYVEEIAETFATLGGTTSRFTGAFFRGMSFR